jgi:hypothetical protein
MAVMYLYCHPNTDDGPHNLNKQNHLYKWHLLMTSLKSSQVFQTSMSILYNWISSIFRTIFISPQINKHTMSRVAIVVIGVVALWVQKTTVINAPSALQNSIQRVYEELLAWYFHVPDANKQSAET